MLRTVHKLTEKKSDFKAASRSMDLIDRGRQWKSALKQALRENPEATPSRVENIVREERYVRERIEGGKTG